jgi:hypothetical protein
VVIPVVAVVVPLVDLMIALPVLIESCRAVMLGTPFQAPGYSPRSSAEAC